MAGCIFFSIKCDNGVSITLSKMDLSFVLTYVVSLKHFFSLLVFFFYSHSISHLLLIPLFPPEPTRPSVAQDYVGIQFQFQRVVRILLHPAALSSLGWQRWNRGQKCACVHMWACMANLRLLCAPLSSALNRTTFGCNCFRSFFTHSPQSLLLWLFRHVSKAQVHDKLLFVLVRNSLF